MNNWPLPRIRPATALVSASHEDGTLNNTTGGSRHWRRARPRWAGVLAVTTGLVLLTAACGGSASKGRPVIHRFRRRDVPGEGTRLRQVRARPRRAELPRPPRRRAGTLQLEAGTQKQPTGPGGRGDVPAPASHWARAEFQSHRPAAAGLPEGRRLHALTRRHQLPGPDLLRRDRKFQRPLQHPHQLAAIHPGPGGLRETHPRGTPLLVR